MACAFTLRYHVIMAATAYSNNFVVIHCTVCDRCPGCWTGLMAGIAYICTVNVTSRFTGCSRSIVATNTGANDITVVYCTIGHWSPRSRSRLMTGIAGVGRIDMTSTLSTGSSAIVTTKAGTDDFVVIYCCCGNGCPCGREYGMTCIADIRAIDVISAFTAGRNAIVAGNTVTDKSCVINSSNLQPVSRVMAVITFQCRLNMACTFTLRNYVVVTTATDTDNLVVVHCAIGNRCPGCWSGLMAGITKVSTVNVVNRLT